jgi:hypothetical protein
MRRYRRRPSPYRRLCGAHSRTTDKPCEAPGNGRGGRCKTEAGRAKVSGAVRDALLRAWAKWDPKARIRYARALAQGLSDRMRSIRKGELARQQREGLL